MVAGVRNDRSLRSVARQFRTSISVVQRWVAWAADQPLDAVDWAGRGAGCRHSARRTDRRVEDRVLAIRKYLRTEDALRGYPETQFLKNGNE